MLCPFCGAPMELGHLYGATERAIRWYPVGWKLADEPFLTTKKKVEQVGGVVVDRLTKFSRVTKTGFFTKERPNSYCCKPCHAFITRFEDVELGETDPT